MARWKAFSENTGPLIADVKKAARPIASIDDLDPLIEQVGDRQFVLPGEASHGTSEFYQWRARISQRLISEKGFSFICVEGDWPDCYQINRYVKGYPGSGSRAQEVIHNFERWPTWMWANWEIVALAEWLKDFNTRAQRKVGFYGLDVYSLWESIKSVVDYLDKKDPEAANLARQAYRCFEPYAVEVQAYAWSTRMTPESCEDEVIDLLKQMRQPVPSYDGDPEAAFNAEQNALVMVDAERYYRAMVRSDQNSWNVRDVHMADTLDRLMRLHGPNAKAIVWAHNTHIGDARATDMASSGMINIGQIVRERRGDEKALLVGFGTHHGTVIAGQEWDALMEVMGVPDAVETSWEDVMHRAGQKAFYLNARGQRQNERFIEERGNRAIGVVYNPIYEQYGNYVPTILPFRYDAYVFVDETKALHPLHLQPEEAPVPETYPWGL